MLDSEPLREAIRRRAFTEQPREPVASVARAVLESGGESVLGIVFFGSRKTRASTDQWSGYDLFVVTRDYRGYYRSLKAAGALRRSPWLVALLNAWLPPNQVSVRTGGEGTPLAKCAVVSVRTLVHETSERRKDHFFVGRLFQPTEVLFARDADTAAEILGALVSAHAVTLSWARPWLPPSFDVETYCRTLLRVSLGREIRPEPAGRSEILWEAQRTYLTEVYSILLEEMARAGELTTPEPGVYALARPVPSVDRWRVAVYFRISMIRATARWFKYIVTFDDWLEYIVRKVQRHSSERIVLTRRERALPIIFLWPRLIRYLLSKNRRGA
jgi:hypothetical protein